MLNLKNIQSFIAVIKRVKARHDVVDMRSYQKVASTTKIKKDEASAHLCGSACCAAGWLAISPEWKIYGGEVGAAGGPMKLSANGKDYVFGSHAISDFLGLPWRDTKDLLGMCIPEHSLYYKDIPISMIGANEILAALKKIEKEAEIQTERLL